MVVSVVLYGGINSRRFFFFFQAEDGIRDWSVTGVQTCALPIGLDVAEREARVAERRHARLASHVGVRLLRPHAEAVHADAEDRDVLHEPTGRKRMKIGRASCRERGESWVGGGTSKKKQNVTAV